MPAKILIEGQNLTLKQGTGIATYARNLTQAVRTAGYSAEGLVNVRGPLDRRDPMLSEIALADFEPDRMPLGAHLRFARTYAFGAPFGIGTYPLTPRGVVVGAAQSNLLPTLAMFDRLHAAVQFSDAANHHFDRYNRRARVKLKGDPALFHATQPIPLVVRGCPNVYTIHDLVPLRLPFATLDNKRHFLRMVRHLCRHADHIVTVSEHSRRDIIALGGVDENRITNTYQATTLPAAVSDTSPEEAARLVRNAFGLEREDYYVVVGAIEPKKNLARLIDAFAASGTTRPLVIVGRPGWHYQDDLDKIAEERFFRQRMQDGVLTFSRKVQFVSYVPAEQLFALVRGARALLFPSLYEGFGVPAVEAMQLGTPVLASNTASLPEVVGEAGLLVDPHDTSAIARGIAALDADDDLRSELRTRGLAQAERFSAPAYATRLAALYTRMLR